jgi:hypothetical protein
MSKSRVYRVWQVMHRRCYDKKFVKYPRYGGRGIGVCDRWQQFENFLADMGEPPTATHQIDRIDNDGPYSPENCRWVTGKENCANKGANIRLTYQGETLILAEWARRLNLDPEVVRKRIHRGWTADQALTLPHGTVVNSIPRDSTTGRFLQTNPPAGVRRRK